MPHPVFVAGAQPFDNLFELLAMVDGKNGELRILARPVGRPVKLLELTAVSKTTRPVVSREEQGQFLPAWAGRRTAMPRDHDRSTSVAKGAAPLDRFPPQPAAQKSRHESVAGAEHIKDFDRKPLPDDPVFQIIGNRTRKNDTAFGAALEHDNRSGARADLAQGDDRIDGAAQDVDFFVGADNHVA